MSGLNYMNNSVPSRNDPINFTNQYNIYNPVIGGPINNQVNDQYVNPTSPQQQLLAAALQNPYNTNQVLNSSLQLLNYNRLQEQQQYNLQNLNLVHSQPMATNMPMYQQIAPISSFSPVQTN